jgi:hypothetical protein
MTFIGVRSFAGYLNSSDSSPKCVRVTLVAPPIAATNGDRFAPLVLIEV